MRVYADFDGTIASCDVTDLVLQTLAPPEWEEIEQQWVSGAIDAATCMRRQIALLDANYAALDALLASVELDPGFPAFVEWCDREGHDIVVVSDGVDYFIRAVLTRHGFGRLPVYSNQLAVDGSKFKLEQPWRRVECAAGSGVCKCAVVAEDKPADVYIGDGRSDECVSPKAGILFAKDKLAMYCRGRNIPFHGYTTFADVQATLSSGLTASDLPARSYNSIGVFDEQA